MKSYAFLEYFLSYSVPDWKSATDYFDRDDSDPVLLKAIETAIIEWLAEELIPWTWKTEVPANSKAFFFKLIFDFEDEPFTTDDFESSLRPEFNSIIERFFVIEKVSFVEAG